MGRRPDKRSNIDFEDMQVRKKSRTEEEYMEDDNDIGPMNGDTYLRNGNNYLPPN